jgi:flagella basal body P-ring formation protein FlgA
MTALRSVLIAALLTAVAAPAFAGAPVALRSGPTARGAAVTLADLFDGAPLAAGKVVLAPAPAPGMNAVLDAGRVQAAARTAGLDWDNAQGLRRIVVTSAAGPSSAARAAPGRSAQALAYARNLAAGELVQASDLVWSNEVIAGPDAPGDPDAVIGQAAKRPLRAGAAVQARDLAAPVMVHRDETISVAFEARGVSLVLQGKALKDASVGESVQVLNPQSKKIIEAVVSGPGKAVVGPRAEALKAAPFATASLR